MKRIPISVEMSMVKACEASECVYNAQSSCHAKAITIGGANSPACDTYLGLSLPHVRAVERQAGVGACKMVNCSFNEDYECSAPEIMVGAIKNSAHCVSYLSRS
jgi:hypothetical protein